MPNNNDLHRMKIRNLHSLCNVFSLSNLNKEKHIHSIDYFENKYHLDKNLSKVL